MIGRCGALLGILCASANAGAQSPSTSVTGRLVTPEGVPASVTQQHIEFRIYDVPNGGVPVWTQAQVVAVSGGVFHATLGGAAAPLPAFSAGESWLSWSLDGAAETGPRIRLEGASRAGSSITASAVPDRFLDGNRFQMHTLPLEALSACAVGQTIVRQVDAWACDGAE